MRPAQGAASSAVLFFGTVGQGFHIHEVSRSRTTMHHSRQESSGRVTSSLQRPLPDSTQHSQQADIHAPGRIGSHNLSRRATADLRLRPRGHWDRQFCCPSCAKRHSKDGSRTSHPVLLSVHVLSRESFTLLPCSVARKVCIHVWIGNLVFSGCLQLAGDVIRLNLL